MGRCLSDVGFGNTRNKEEEEKEEEKDRERTNSTRGLYVLKFIHISCYSYLLVDHFAPTGGTQGFYSRNLMEHPIDHLKHTHAVW